VCGSNFASIQVKANCIPDFFELAVACYVAVRKEFKRDQLPVGEDTLITALEAMIRRRMTEDPPEEGRERNESMEWRLFFNYANIFLPKIQWW
jgi:hypothetical protein